jgi:siroheme synthase
MAGAHLARLAAVLLSAGLHRSTPAATIENGTLPDARVRHGRLEELESLGAGRGTGPLLVVVGKTAALASDLAGPLAAGARLAAETGSSASEAVVEAAGEIAATLPFRRTGR